MSINKERFTLNFRKNPVVTIVEINDFLKRVNDKKHGKKITLHEIIADCVKSYIARDIKRLQKSSMSAMDLIRIRYEQDMEKSKQKVNFEDYLARKMGIKF